MLLAKRQFGGGNVDLTRLERLILFVSLLALVTVTVLVQAKAAAMEGTSWASPLRQRLRPVGHPKDLTKAWGMPWPKTGASWDAFFFVGMPIAGDHEIYGDLSDVPPQRLREDMGLVVCKSF